MCNNKERKQHMNFKAQTCFLQLQFIGLKYICNKFNKNKLMTTAQYSEVPLKEFIHTMV